MTLTTTLQDKIHNEARMRWESEKSPSDPEWLELPTEEVSRRVEAVLADETLSLVELRDNPAFGRMRQPNQHIDAQADFAALERQISELKQSDLARAAIELAGDEIAGSSLQDVNQRLYDLFGAASPPQKDKTG